MSAGRRVTVWGRAPAPYRTSAQERQAARPVAHDIDGVEVARVAGDVEDPGAALRRALPGPPAIALVERRRLGGDLVLEPAAVPDERGDPRGASALGLARVRVALSDVRGHGRVSSVTNGAGDGRPVTASCERGASPV